MHSIFVTVKQSSQLFVCWYMDSFSSQLFRKNILYYIVNDLCSLINNIAAS